MPGRTPLGDRPPLDMAERDGGSRASYGAAAQPSARPAPIQIDPVAVQAGIAAALRRAFNAPTPGRSAAQDHFDDLLAKLH